jgi:hypothetical protein
MRSRKEAVAAARAAAEAFLQRHGAQPLSLAAVDAAVQAAGLPDAHSSHQRMAAALMLAELQRRSGGRLVAYDPAQHHKGARSEIPTLRMGSKTAADLMSRWGHRPVRELHAWLVQQLAAGSDSVQQKQQQQQRVEQQQQGGAGSAAAAAAPASADSKSHNRALLSARRWVLALLGGGIGSSSGAAAASPEAAGQPDAAAPAPVPAPAAGGLSFKPSWAAQALPLPEAAQQLELWSTARLREFGDWAKRELLQRGTGMQAGPSGAGKGQCDRAKPQTRQRQQQQQQAQGPAGSVVGHQVAAQEVRLQAGAAKEVPAAAS